jgi:hypothetical protein
MTCPLRRVIVLGLLLGLAGAGGCSADTGKGTVRGEVTLDGQPLKDGRIWFVPEDNQSPPVDTAIVDGRFRLAMPVGPKRVRISASKVVGKRRMYDTPNSPVVDEIKELLPARYNDRSELTMTVQPGVQDKRFDLKSQ